MWSCTPVVDACHNHCGSGKQPTELNPFGPYTSTISFTPLKSSQESTSFQSSPPPGEDP